MLAMNPVRRFAAAAALLIATHAGATGRVAVVSERQLEDTWILDPGSPRILAGYPDAAADRSQDACVSIGYLINAAGTTSDFSELKSWTSVAPDRMPSRQQVQAFVQISAAVVSRWRYRPSSGKPRPTYTSAVFAFDGSGQLGRAAIGEHCRIRDLQAFMDNAPGNARQAGLKRWRYEHHREEAWGCSSFSSACAVAGQQ